MPTESAVVGEGQAVPMLMAAVLCEKPAQLRPHTMCERLLRRLPGLELLSGDQSDMLHLAHTQHIQQFAEGGRMPAQTVVFGPQAIDLEKLAPARQQTWEWKEAASVLSHCTSQVLVTEFASQALDYKMRLHLFQEVLLGVVDFIEPAAIHMISSTKLVNPEDYRRTYSPAADSSSRVRAALNVRFFNVTNGQDGDCVMDTLGLAPLGLPDLQMHFRGLEPGRVAGWLYGAALYIYEKGDVVGNGHTIEGLESGQKWKCRHERSLISPERVVLDVDPGRPFGAGKRS